MEEALCPRCGANVEGLTQWCDCCGAALHPQKTLFRRMIYSTGAFYDIGLHLNKIFEKLDEIPPELCADVLERIEFDFWCYPTGKRTGVSYYASRKQAIVTIEVDGDAYLYGTADEKLALLTGEVREKMEMLRLRLAKRNIHPDALFGRIDAALQ